MIAYGQTIMGKAVHMTRQTPPYVDGKPIRTLCKQTIVHNVSEHEPMEGRSLCKRCVRKLSVVAKEALLRDVFTIIGEGLVGMDKDALSTEAFIDSMAELQDRVGEAIGLRR